MQRRDFNRIALATGFYPMLENAALAKVAGQTGTFTQTPTKNGVVAMSTSDPMGNLYGGASQTS